MISPSGIRPSDTRTVREFGAPPVRDGDCVSTVPPPTSAPPEGNEDAGVTAATGEL